MLKIQPLPSVRGEYILLSRVEYIADYNPDTKKINAAFDLEGYPITNVPVLEMIRKEIGNREYFPAYDPRLIEIRPYVEEASNHIRQWINSNVPASFPSMPYGRQYVLEELIKDLQRHV